MKTKRSSGSRRQTSFFYYLFFAITGILVTAMVYTLFSTFVTGKNFVDCANSISCVKNLDVAVENNAEGIFLNRTVIPPQIQLTDSDSQPNVLGDDTATGEKHIYVDLTNQLLSAYQGDKLYFQTPISSGKWNRTPKGDFRIWIKLRATRMSGGSGADYYNLPNVEYTMFYANSDVPRSAGYSLHGAYWHNNFGHPMSHGCVNMRNIDAKIIYDWADPPTNGYTTYSSETNPGTLITVFGDAPI